MKALVGLTAVSLKTVVLSLGVLPLFSAASAPLLNTAIASKPIVAATPAALATSTTIETKADGEDAKHRLQGSWQLVSGRYVDGGGNWVDYQSLGLSAIKVISAGHFSFTTIKTADNKREFWSAGGGEYRLEHNRYTEYPSLNSFEVPVGQGFEFEYELKGDEWHTRRIEGGILKEEEVWRRLD